MISRSKFRAKKCEMDGITFDSKREMRRYCELKMMQDGGIISKLELQVPWELVPTQRGENGKVIERPVKYVADFVYQRDGKTVVEDVKSPITKTPSYIIKRKLMLYTYGLRIVEV